MLCKFENILIGPSGTFTGWTHVEHFLNAHQVRMNANKWVGTAPEYPLSAHDRLWVSIEHPLNTHWDINANKWVGTAPEHPSSAHDRLWVSIEHFLDTRWVRMTAYEWVLTSPWTPIECAWPPMSECEHLWVRMNAIESLLKAIHHDVTMRKFSFVSELNTPRMLVSAHEHLWVSIEHTLNTCEHAWMPLSQYWTPPDHFWVCVNTFEWALNTPWTLVSAHECQWVSRNIHWTPIECA